MIFKHIFHNNMSKFYIPEANISEFDSYNLTKLSNAVCNTLNATQLVQNIIIVKMYKTMNDNYDYTVVNNKFYSPNEEHMLIELLQSKRYYISDNKISQESVIHEMKTRFNRYSKLLLQNSCYFGITLNKQDDETNLYYISKLMVIPSIKTIDNTINVFATNNLSPM